MAYIKTNWVDQEGQVRYTETEDDGYKIFTPNFEEVTELGTPVDAVHLNHIEEGIEQCYIDCENLIKSMYPVGSIYIGVTANCPLSALFGTWAKISEGLTLQQADTNHPVGTEIPAGLPNIKGTFPTIEGASKCYNLDNFGNAIYRYKSNNSSNVDNSNGDADDTAALDASRDSSIYGSSDTVQPPALAVNIWQRTA